MSVKEQNIDGKCPNCGSADYYRVFHDGARWVKCDECGFEAQVS